MNIEVAVAGFGGGGFAVVWELAKRGRVGVGNAIDVLDVAAAAGQCVQGVDVRPRCPRR